MTLKYTTLTGFLKTLGLYKGILEFQPGSTPRWENVALYYAPTYQYILGTMGIVSDSLVLRRSSDNALLTITTHYTFDPDTSIVTLTAAGNTYLGTDELQANYGYCTLGTDLDNTYATALLEQSERDVEQMCNVVFADQTATNPTYQLVNNELQPGQGFAKTFYNAELFPLVKLQTTTNGAYTTGGVSITLTDATGFPNAATIYIGGNKVAYTAKSGNVLTIPATTPSIADASVVRGEVVEVSYDYGGLTPSFTVLVPDVGYAIDYNTGYVQIWQDYYFQSITGNITPPDGVYDRVRMTYMQAWHDVDVVCSIPTPIVQLTYTLAGKMLAERAVRKAQISGRSSFSPETMNVDDEYIKRVVANYKSFLTSKLN
jgi:hypothetical protein